MPTRPFDRLSRSLSTDLSRRKALQVSGLGLASALAARQALGTAAQDVPATPVTIDGVTLTNGAFLFVQTATSGSFTANPSAGTPAADATPAPGGGADYLLTLAGHTGRTIYFSDRPERIFGEGPTDQFIDTLGFSTFNPPNAALVTNDADGNEDTLVVELIEPVYDAGAATVTYGVNILSDYEGSGLAHATGQQADEDLAPTFGNASLFYRRLPGPDGMHLDWQPRRGGRRYRLAPRRIGRAVLALGQVRVHPL